MIHVLFISLIVFAIHYCFQKGEILGITQKIPLGKLADPLRDCPVCMVFWYGSAIYFYAWHESIFLWFATVFAAMGLNAVLVRLMPDKESPTLHESLDSIRDTIEVSSKNIIETIFVIDETNYRRQHDNQRTSGKAQANPKR